MVPTSTTYAENPPPPTAEQPPQTSNHQKRRRKLEFRRKIEGYAREAVRRREGVSVQYPAGGVVEFRGEREEREGQSGGD